MMLCLFWGKYNTENDLDGGSLYIIYTNEKLCLKLFSFSQHIVELSTSIIQSWEGDTSKRMLHLMYVNKKCKKHIMQTKTN